MDPKLTELAKIELCKRIAGEIVLAELPGEIIKKWREIFHIPQNVLAEEINVMPSVISDYENNRRKSPGIKMISKIVKAMIALDERKDGSVISKFSEFSESDIANAILDIKEYTKPITFNAFLKAINGSSIGKKTAKNICGYTIIDSLKAIVNFSPEELEKVYGLTTERALIFTNVSTGRSPLVAIKVTGVKPSVVVLHKIKHVDDVAIRIADVEDISIVVTEMETKDIIENLRKIR